MIFYPLSCSHSALQGLAAENGAGAVPHNDAAVKFIFVIRSGAGCAVEASLTIRDTNTLAFKP